MFKPSLAKPIIYSTGSTADGYALVSGSSSQSGSLLGLLVENAAVGTLYVQIFDGYAQPANGSHPVAEISVLAGSQASLDFGGVNCIPFKKGIVVAGSSTQWSYTPSASSMYLTAFWIKD